MLTDPGKESSDRVALVLRHNLDSSPALASMEMEKTWHDRTRLKRQAGISLCGRDNLKPALHLTLSWHAEDGPSLDHMAETALSSLTTLGLEEHQALIAVHEDKDHPHVHLVINTVHPSTGKSAPLKYSKERLSRWAEAYEHEHGIRCEQRLENNQARDEIKEKRRQNANDILLATQRGSLQPDRVPYAPVRDRSLSRGQWFKTKALNILTGRQPGEVASESVPSIEKRTPRSGDALMIDPKDLDKINKIIRERETSPECEAAKDRLAFKQAGERNQLGDNLDGAVEWTKTQNARMFRKNWNAVHRRQTKEKTHVAELADRGLLERITFVTSNRDRLRNSHSSKDLIGLARDPKSLLQAIGHCHRIEREALEKQRLIASLATLEGIFKEFEAQSNLLVDKHRREFEPFAKQVNQSKQGQRPVIEVQREIAAELGIELRPITSIERPFKRKGRSGRAAGKASQMQSRAMRIREAMQDWSKRYKDQDRERDLE